MIPTPESIFSRDPFIGSNYDVDRKDQFRIYKQILIGYPLRQKITVPFHRLYQMIQSYILNDQISYDGTTPCIPGKQYEYRFLHYNHIYGENNKYTIPEHPIYEMNSTDYRQLITLMNSQYGDGECESFVDHLHKNYQVKILDLELALTLLKREINYMLTEYIGYKLKVNDIFNYFVMKIINDFKLDIQQIMELIFDEKGKYVFDRWNARCTIGCNYGWYLTNSLYETISITYNGNILDIEI